MDKKEHDKLLPERYDAIGVYTPGRINKEGKAIMQVIPIKSTTLESIRDYIVEPKWAERVTAELRTITDKEKNRDYKLMNFYVATFGCYGKYRSAKTAESVTGLMVIDFDEEDIRHNPMYAELSNEEMVPMLRLQLLADRNLHILLMFTSPNGNGVKIVVYVGDRQGLSFGDCFKAISAYIKWKYGIMPDQSGSDLCRPCYLPHDPECYLAKDHKCPCPPKIDLRLWLEQLRQPKPSRPQHLTTHTGSARDAYELVERWVGRDTAYAEGSYNRYVSKCGYLLCEFGILEQEAEDWAVNRFYDYDSADVRCIFRSCYKNGRFGTRQFNALP